MARALTEFLPDILQNVKPWMSDDDIGAGARWSHELNQQLQEGNFGVLCLTPENMGAPWLLFEVGSLAKSVSTAKVVPYRLGLRATDVPYPLAQFQGVDANEAGTRKLVTSLNQAVQTPIDEQRLGRTFERAWPDLKGRINAIPTFEDVPRRSDRDLLEEIQSLLRAQHKPQIRAPEDRVLDGLWELHKRLLQRAEYLTNMVHGAEQLNREIPDDALERIREEQDLLGDAIKRYDALIQEFGSLSRMPLPRNL